MKKIIVVYLLYAVMMIVSINLVLGQLLLCIYGTMYYIQNEMIFPLNKVTLFAIFGVVSILSFAVSILALMTILPTFQNVVKKLTIAEEKLMLPLRMSKITQCIIAIITLDVLFLCASIYLYGYIDGTRTDFELKCGPSVIMGLFIMLLSLIVIFTTIGIVEIFCEVRKRKRLKKLSKE